MSPIREAIASSSVSAATALLVGCSIAILLLGPKLSRTVDQWAARSGWGQALSGALLMGAATSLPGVILSVTAAYRGNPDLAVANALGGIAVQTLFLVFADMAYRRANLEHAAASLPNMMQTVLLIVLLGIIALGRLAPDVHFWGVHPLTPILFMVYLYGLKLAERSRTHPMWKPRHTEETREDSGGCETLNLPTTSSLIIRFVPLALALGATGWIMEGAASRVVEAGPMRAATVGVLVTSVCTSLPELVTSVAAVRQGALTLAVGGIIGGNAFDTLFTAASDIAYREGSIYHTIDDSMLFWVITTMIMSGVLMMGLIRREKKGPGGIGAESVAIMVLYGAAVTTVVMQQ